MILNCILWLLSIMVSALILFPTGLYLKHYFDIIFVLLIPVYYLALFGLLLMILFFVGICIDTKKEDIKPNRVCYWIAYQVNYVLCLLTCKITIIGKEKVPRNERFLLVYNHRSNWDPMVIMAKLTDYDIYYISKPQNMNIPICGPFIKRAGFIPLDRENNKEGLKSIVKAINMINSDKGSIALAPEGTRNKKLEEPLLEFHAGSFKVATKTKKPIVVCTIKNCEYIHKNFPFKKTKITINILKVLTYDEYKDMDTIEISNEIHNLMLQDVKEEN